MADWWTSVQGVVGTATGLGLAGALTWAFKQESRITVLERESELREQRADERHEDIKEDLKEIKAELKKKT